MKFVAMVHVQVKPESRLDFEGLADDNNSVMTDIPGLISFDFLRPQDPDGDYVTVSVWEDKTAMEAFSASDANKQAHAAMMKLGNIFEGRPTTNEFDVL